MSPFQCSPDFTYTVEPDGIRLQRRDDGRTLKLPYPDAALWDFLMRGVGRARIIQMMGHIGGFDGESSTREFVSRCLTSWQRDGLIVPAAGGSESQA